VSTPRFVTIAFALALLCAAQVLQAQNNGDSEAEERPSRYQLRDISADGSPVHVAGNVTFRDNPAYPVFLSGRRGR
jgi:c-di-GMP-binding flagellar brake protein YcgR